MFWLPIIGPIIQGLASVFIKFKDTELGKYTVDGKVDIEAIKASANIIETTRDDIGIRLSRDVIIFPVAVWTAIASWDTIIVYHYPNLMFKVAPYPPSLAFLPYAVMTFLLGNIAMNSWKRK